MSELTTAFAGASLSPELLADVRARAAVAAHHAYSPYSRFRVGAALLLDNPHAGVIFTGCNVENASFRLTTCAEQTAIVRAVAELGPGIRLRAIAIANLNQAASMPCGACRQTLLEFAPDPAAVAVLFPGEDPAGRVVDQRCTLDDLIPAAFRLRANPCDSEPSSRPAMLKAFPSDRAGKPPAIRALDLILHKRSGGELSTEQIRFFVDAVVNNDATRDHPRRRASDRNPWTPFITDAQIGALLMAIFTHHLSARELATLTDAMRASGEVFDRSTLDTVLVDKHSTGGVGDKTSLLLAPILAAAGLAHPTRDGIPGVCVPMISGRSLGHTGGTLDKLESIPGFATELSLDRLTEILRTTGAAIIGQTPELVPADRLLYAMRDHTGTVESPVLIAASIMSKKLAESLDGLVLDVKVGSGAFLPTFASARLLADLMVEAGEAAGTRTVALLSSMDQPLGRFAGNWLEVVECVEILAGRIHPLSRDLLDLTLALAGHMLHLAGIPNAETPDAGQLLARKLLASGQAYRSWLAIVAAQGGDTSVFAEPFTHHKPAAVGQVTASRAGYVSAMNCAAIGWAVQRLGAGRERPGDPVSAHAGIEMHAKIGDAMRAGDPLITLFADNRDRLGEAEQVLRDALHLTADPPAPVPLIHEIISASAPRK